MIVLIAVIAFILMLRPKRGLVCLARLAVVGVVAATITSYFWLPFIRYQQYLDISPYLQQWKYDSFGAQDILFHLLGGQMYDEARLPVFTLLLTFGLAAAVTRPTPTKRLGAVLFVVWLMLYFGRVTWGLMADLVPMHQGMLFHRFVGGVDFAAILLAGIGGEWLWERFALFEEPWSKIAPAAILLLLLVPALIERYGIYHHDARLLRYASSQIEADQDLRAIIDTLKTLPPGRTYAGQRTDWGKDFKVGEVPVNDILTFNQFDMFQPPFQGLSLNSDFVFHFDDANPAMYNLFNVRYVVAPSKAQQPPFLTPLKQTPRYTLYRVETSGYGELANAMNSGVAGSQLSLFESNRNWLKSDAVAKGNFIRWSYRFGAGPVGGVIYAPYRGGGTVSDEEFGQGLIRLRVNSVAPALLVIKTTYHPNWHLTIDGRPADAFMASPSFIGVRVPGGDHQVVAEYRSDTLKKSLLAAGTIVLLLALLLRGSFALLDTRICQWVAKLKG